jgi:hypothetical protein
MLANFHAKDLQQQRRFPSEGLLATPAVLIPPCSPASLRFEGFSSEENSKIARDFGRSVRRICGIGYSKLENAWIRANRQKILQNLSEWVFLGLRIIASYIRLPV